jgi:hypothetical protein
MYPMLFEATLVKVILTEVSSIPIDGASVLEVGSKVVQFISVQLQVCLHSRDVCIALN